MPSPILFGENMTILYKAFDSTIFEDEYECEDYENRICHPLLENIEFFDENNHSYFINFDSNDPFSDSTYNHCRKVIIHDSYEFNDFIWLAKYCGWCEFYEQITEPGIWIRHEFSDYLRRFEGYWEKVES